MTTPQDTLYRIREDVINLRKSFYRETDENTYSVFDDIADIRKANDQIIKDLERLNGTMALVLKVLNEKGSKK